MNKVGSAIQLQAKGFVLAPPTAATAATFNATLVASDRNDGALIAAAARNALVNGTALREASLAACMPLPSGGGGGSSSSGGYGGYGAPNCTITARRRIHPILAGFSLLLLVATVVLPPLVPAPGRVDGGAARAPIADGRAAGATGADALEIAEGGGRREATLDVRVTLAMPFGRIDRCSRTRHALANSSLTP